MGSQQAGHGERLRRCRTPARYCRRRGTRGPLGATAGGWGRRRGCWEGWSPAEPGGGDAGSESRSAEGTSDRSFSTQNTEQNTCLLAGAGAAGPARLQDRLVWGPGRRHGSGLKPSPGAPPAVHPRLPLPPLSSLLGQLLLQSPGVEGPGEGQSRGLLRVLGLLQLGDPRLPAGSGAPASAQPESLRQPPPLGSAEAARGPGAPAPCPRRPRGLPGPRRCQRGSAPPGARRRRSPCSAPRPSPPAALSRRCPSSRRDPPPGAGGQRGQRLGSTRGSASASGSLLRGWDAPSSLQEPALPGRRRAGSPARPAAAPPGPPARAGHRLGAPRAARSGRPARAPHMQIGRRRGPRGAPGRDRRVRGRRPSVPRHRRSPLRARRMEGGGHRVEGPVAPQRRAPGGSPSASQPPRPPGERPGASATLPRAPRASPRALLAAPSPPPLWRTPSPHVHARPPRAHHAHPEWCDLRPDALPRPEFTLSASTRHPPEPAGCPPATPFRRRTSYKTLTESGSQKTWLLSGILLSLVSLELV